MEKVLIEHKREECIGCGVCAAVALEFWEIADDGKATLKGGAEKKGKWEREIEDHIEENKQAAEGCPILAICLKRNGEKIFPKG